MKRTTPRTRIRLSEVPDEQSLIELAIRGDREAFDQLVRAHYARVVATAFRLLGNPEDAEDLAQECFVRAHRGLASFRAEASFSSWLRRIIVHLARDRYRHQGRRPESLPLTEALGLAKADQPDQEVSRRELALLLAEAVSRLPDHLRVALVLRTREGLSYSEIAAACGVTPATARTQVMKARRALLRTLSPYMEWRES
jgi:RNA polymerase sigma-70 factor (ECF subfamily)